MVDYIYWLGSPKPYKRWNLESAVMAQSQQPIDWVRVNVGRYESMAIFSPAVQAKNFRAGVSSSEAARHISVFIGEVVDYWRHPDRIWSEWFGLFAKYPAATEFIWKWQRPIWNPAGGVLNKFIGSRYRVDPRIVAEAQTTLNSTVFPLDGAIHRLAHNHFVVGPPIASSIEMGEGLKVLLTDTFRPCAYI